jgi:hypothetical protein
MEITEVLAINGSENIVAFLFLIRDVTEGTRIRGELHARQNSCGRIGSDNSICSCDSNYRSMRPGFQILHNLAITEEWEDSLLNDLLEDKILIIVTEF